jgi:hypothetical protein
MGFRQHGRQIAEGGTSLKAVFVSVCGNLQHMHMTKHKIFASLHPSAMMQNAVKIKIETSVFLQKRRLLNLAINTQT